MISSSLTVIGIIGTLFMCSRIIRKLNDNDNWLIDRARLLWEGIPEEIQMEMETLDDLETYMLLEERRLERLESEMPMKEKNDCVSHIVENKDMQSRHLKFIDNVTSFDQNDQINNNNTDNNPHNWKKDLSVLSYTLDQLASEVDAIESYGHKDIKRRKKILTISVVKLMDRVDCYMKKFGMEVQVDSFLRMDG